MAASILAFGLLAPLRGEAAKLEDLLQVCSSPKSSPENALRFCQMALDTGELGRKNTALVHHNAGLAAYDLGRFAAALASQDEAIRLDPRMARAYVSRGQVRETLGRPKDARLDYETAIGIDRKDPTAYLARGELNFAEGAWEAAVEDFSTAARLDRRWTAPLFERGRAHFALGDYARAEQDFSAVIAMDPPDATAWVNRGEARAALGSARALKDFDRAVLLAPEWGGAYYARGRYLDRAGQTEEANADFLRAFQLGHSAPDLIERVQALSGG